MLMSRRGIETRWSRSIIFESDTKRSRELVNFKLNYCPLILWFWFFVSCARIEFHFGEEKSAQFINAA